MQHPSSNLTIHLEQIVWQVRTPAPSSQTLRMTQTEPNFKHMMLLPASSPDHSFNPTLPTLSIPLTLFIPPQPL